MKNFKNLTWEDIAPVVYGIAAGCVIGIPLVWGIIHIKEQTTLPQKFEVMDTYKNCEVVRYTPPNSARYHYFLDCANETN
jgi:hypothetical protein